MKPEVKIRDLSFNISNYNNQKTFKYKTLYSYWDVEMDNQMLFAYIAGIIDGEGTLGVYRHKSKKARRGYVYEPCIYVVNTNEQLIDLLIETFGGHKRERKTQKSHHKTPFVWEVRTQNMTNILYKILPFLFIKRKHGILLLEFLEINKNTPVIFKRNPNNKNRFSGYRVLPQRMHDIYDELRRLNKRGK